MRRIAALAVLFAVASGLLAPSPSQAAERQKETISRDQSVSKKYPPLGGGTPTKSEPNQCAVVTFCDNIPLDIIEPKNIPLGDDFYVVIEVTWDVPALNDLDVFVYDNGQTRQEEEENGGGEATDPPKTSPYTEKGANTNAHPARVVLPEPKLGRYNLVVHNATTSEVGYNLSIEMVVAKFAPPFESLEDPPPDPTSEDGPPPDTSGDVPEPPPVTDQGPGDVGGGTLDPVDPALDSDLEGLRRRGPSGPSDQVAGSLPTGSTRPPAPPSGLALLFWLAIVPGAILGGLTFGLLRRRRAGFSFG